MKINDSWYTYQTFRPFSCGMGVGIGKLFPNYKGEIELENTTTGKITLPFRLKIFLDKQEYYSNEITITCSVEEFDMIKKPIRRFTW